MPHGTFVDFDCAEGEAKSGDGGPLKCDRGRLLPENPGITYKKQLLLLLLTCYLSEDRLLLKDDEFYIQAIASLKI